MTTQQKPASTLAVDVLLFVCFVLGAAIVFYAIREMTNAGSLGHEAVRVTARVTDSRVLSYQKRGDSHELRYAFDVGERTFSFKDSTGREDLWAVVTQDAFEAARREGRLEVEYLPTDPWVNRPVHAANPGSFDEIAGLVVGLLCMSPALLAGMAALRRRRMPT